MYSMVLFAVALDVTVLHFQNDNPVNNLHVTDPTLPKKVFSLFNFKAFKVIICQKYLTNIAWRRNLRY